MITENRQTYNACTGNKLAKITGIELCSELSYPNASLVENAPYFPLTGPIKAGLSLYKRDKEMKGYKIEARSTHVSVIFFHVVVVICCWFCCCCFLISNN
jgi:hypothetical protein